jgi:hypothetical protein
LLSEIEKTIEKIRKKQTAKVTNGFDLPLTTSLKREDLRLTTRKSKKRPSPEAIAADPLLVSQGNGLNIRNGD